MRHLFPLFIIAVLFAMAMVDVADAISSDFQNDPSTFEFCYDWYDYYISPASIGSAVFLDTYSALPSSYYGMRIRNSIPAPYNYVAWTAPQFFLTAPYSSCDYQSAIAYSDTQRTNIGNTNIGTGGAVTGTGDLYDMRVKVVRSDGRLYMYLGNVLIAQTEPIQTTTPTTWEIYAGPLGAWGTSVIDDVAYGSNAEGMVATIPSTWRVAKDIGSPELTGLYDATDNDVYNTYMHATFSMAENDGTYSISIDGDEQIKPIPQYIPGVTVRDINGVQQQPQKLSGYVTFDLVGFMANKSYGVHQVVLKHGGSTIDSYDFYYMGSATVETNINFDRDIYASQDSMQISTNLSNEIWEQAGAASFHGCLFDSTLGTVIPDSNWTINMQQQTHSTAVSTDLFPASGQYKAGLFAVMPGGEEVILDTDTCQIYTNKIVYDGFVNDAQAGTVIQGATVTVTQGGTTFTDTTDDLGWFEIVGLEKDTATTISFTKSGYQEHTASTQFNEYKRYTVNIAMMPTAVAHTGTAITGIVYAAPDNTLVGGATVELLDEGVHITSTTSSDKGFYIFNDTTPDHSYTIAVTKTGFAPYSDGVQTPLNPGDVVIKDVVLTPVCTLRVNMVDDVQFHLIPDTMAVALAGGYGTLTTTSGYVTFSDLPMGSLGYTITGSGWQTMTGTAVLAGNENITINCHAVPIVPTTVPAITATPTPAIISINGTVYAMLTGGTLSGVNVSLEQEGITRYATSAGNGDYVFAGIVYNKLCTINATMTGFSHTPFSFTPVGSSTFLVDIYMMEDLPEFDNGEHPAEAGCAGATGMVVGGVYHQLVEHPTVTISNGTWNGTATVEDGGVWWIGTLKPGTSYTATAEAAGYVTKSVPFTAPSVNKFMQVEIVLDQVYTLTINVRDVDSQALITSTSVTVECSNGQVKNTTAGVATFPNLAYNTYTFQGTAEGYQRNGISVLVYGSIAVDLFMQKAPTSADSQISYSVPPHNVRFVTQNLMGIPLAGVGVTAVGTTTTVPDRGIFNAIFGWTDKYSTANLTNASMSDTTASDGSVVFLMSELIKYRVGFADAVTGINQTIDVYPQESVYVITLGDRPFTAPAATAVNTTVWADAPEGKNATLYVAYNDSAARTTSLQFIVRNSTNATILARNYPPGTSTVTDSYPVPHTSGESYVWGIVAQHQDYGTIEKWNGITLHSRLVDLGLEEIYYTWISIAAIIMFTAIFSGSNSKYGYVLVPIFAGILWWIGWMPASGLVIACMFAVGVISYFTRAQGV